MALSSANVHHDMETETRDGGMEQAGKEKDQIATTRTNPTEELSEYDQEVMRRLRWNIDIWILPLLSFIYFLAFLDRTDIGNVQGAGMQAAIHANRSQ